MSTIMHSNIASLLWAMLAKFSAFSHTPSDGWSHRGNCHVTKLTKMANYIYIAFTVHYEKRVSKYKK